jgi:hypothetical protein
MATQRGNWEAVQATFEAIPEMDERRPSLIFERALQKMRGFPPRSRLLAAANPADQVGLRTRLKCGIKGPACNMQQIPTAL